jgi:hypothetical protein
MTEQRDLGVFDWRSGCSRRQRGLSARVKMTIRPQRRPPFALAWQRAPRCASAHPQGMDAARWRSPRVPSGRDRVPQRQTTIAVILLIDTRDGRNARAAAQRGSCPYPRAGERIQRRQCHSRPRVQAPLPSREDCGSTAASPRRPTRARRRSRSCTDSGPAGTRATAGPSAIPAHTTTPGSVDQCEGKPQSSKRRAVRARSSDDVVGLDPSGTCRNKSAKCRITSRRAARSSGAQPRKASSSAATPREERISSSASTLVIATAENRRAAAEAAWRPPGSTADTGPRSGPATAPTSVLAPPDACSRWAIAPTTETQRSASAAAALPADLGCHRRRALDVRGAI